MLTSWISLFAAKDSGIVSDWPSKPLFVHFVRVVLFLGLLAAI
jgi:hypothetical protein